MNSRQALAVKPSVPPSRLVVSRYQDHVVAAGCLYALSAVAVAVSRFPPVHSSLASLINASDSLARHASDRSVSKTRPSDERVSSSVHTLPLTLVSEYAAQSVSVMP